MLSYLSGPNLPGFASYLLQFLNSVFAISPTFIFGFFFPESPMPCSCLTRYCLLSQRGLLSLSLLPLARPSSHHLSSTSTLLATFLCWLGHAHPSIWSCPRGTEAFRPLRFVGLPALVTPYCCLCLQVLFRGQREGSLVTPPPSGMKALEGNCYEP